MGNTYWRPFGKADEESFFSIVKGEGVFLYDINGKKYQDAYSGLWNVNYGYSENEIKDAMKRQIDKLPYCNPITLETPIATELSDVLCRLTHDEITKVLYTCSGSEAVEAAIKIARKYSGLTGRNKHGIAVISESYHGSYYGSMSASFYDDEEKSGYGPMLEGFHKLVLPFSRECKTEELTDECKKQIIDKLDEQLKENKDDLCAIIVEPILASGGVIPLFEEYLSKINSFCKENDILFICDEVATGFGRTGTMFRFQKYYFKPDIITMSKGINNGYLPLGAVCISNKIENLFLKHQQNLFHLSTQNANPICLSGALATIRKMEKDNILKKVKYSSEYLRRGLKEKIEKCSLVSEIRIYGLMIAIDLAYENTNYPINKDLLIKIISKIYSLGCFAGISYVKDITACILIFPQFIATEDELDNIIRIVEITLSNY